MLRKNLYCQLPFVVSDRRLLIPMGVDMPSRGWQMTKCSRPNLKEGKATRSFMCLLDFKVCATNYVKLCSK